MPKLNMFRKLGSSSIFIGVKEVKDEKHAETLIKAGLATLFEEKKEEPKKEAIKEEKKSKKSRHKK